MNRFFILICFLGIAACSGSGRYDASTYLREPEADSVLTSIISYLSLAPSYTTMGDRFKPEHRAFYVSLLPKFTLQKYYESDAGIHYFYVIRPGAKVGDLRGVGGYFKMADPSHLTGFREVFVTPILPEADLKGRVAFLFDEMVKGTVNPYLTMPSYVQWPNEITEYDTVTYAWKARRTR